MLSAYCTGTNASKLRARLAVLLAFVVPPAAPIRAQESSANLVVQVGHQPRVNTVALSGDGSYALTGGDDGYARLWEISTGREIRRLDAKYGVESLAMTTDARWALISDGHDASFRDLRTGNEVANLTRGDTSAGGGIVALSDDAHWALTGSSDADENRGVRLWNLQDRNALSRVIPADPEKKIGSIAVTPDGRWALTAGPGPISNSISFHLHEADEIARVWDLKSMREVRQLRVTRIVRGQSVTSPIGAVAITSDGARGLTGSVDGIARLWDLRTGRVLQQLKGHEGEVSMVRITPNGRRALTTSLADHSARLWDLGTGRQLRKLDVDTEVRLSIAISADGRMALVGTDAAEPIVWDLTTGDARNRLRGGEASVLAVAVSSDGHSILTGCDDNTLRLWNTDSGSQRVLGVGQGPFQSVAMTPNGQWALTSGKDNAALLWNLESEQPVQTLAGHEGAVSAAAITPDGRTGITGSTDNSAIAWDLSSGKALCRMQGGSHEIAGVALTADGRWAVTAADTESTRVWDIRNCREVREIENTDGRGAPLAVSADGSLIVLGIVAGDIPVWNMSRVAWTRARGEIVKTGDGYYVLSPKGGAPAGPYPSATEAESDADAKAIERPAFSSFPGIVYPDGSGVSVLKDAGDVTNSIVITPDGKFIFTAADDKMVRLWDARTAKELRRFEKSRSSGGRYSLATTPDAGLLVIGVPGATTLWNTKTGRSLQLVSYKDSGWCVVDTYGRFDSSGLDENPPLHWVTSADPMHPRPLEIFMRDYYTPRLLTRFVAGENLAQVPPIGDIANRVQPEVAVIKVESGRSPGRVKVTVRAAGKEVDQQQSGLQDLRLFRDGQLVGNGYKEGPLKSDVYVFDDVRLPASSRNVTFSAYAFNSARIKSPTAQFPYSYVPAGSAQNMAWLLQIGVNHYEAWGCELRYAVNDASKLQLALEQRLRKRGLEIKSRLLTADSTSSTATKAQIRAALVEIAGSATPDDVVFVSFSGHGYTDKSGQFYLVPSNVTGSCGSPDGEFLKNTISADELTEWLRPVDAREITLILDSCYSAESIETNDFKPGPMGSRGLGQLAYDKRMRILAASQSDQQAREDSALEQGVLSYVLTEVGLAQGKADWRPADHRITIGEWLAYAAEQVPRMDDRTKHEPGRGVLLNPDHRASASIGQVPAVFDFSRQDDFVLQ
jgi:WD40 repeat protein